MKETGLTGKRRSTTIAATPDDGKSQRKRIRGLHVCQVSCFYHKMHDVPLSLLGYNEEDALCKTSLRTGIKLYALLFKRTSYLEGGRVTGEAKHS